MSKRRQFGSVKRLPSGRWLARYRDGAGQRLSAPGTFATKAEADRWLASVQTDLARGQWVDPRTGQIKFRDWVEEWRATTVDLRPSTLDGYEVNLRCHVLPTFGDVPLADISPVHVRQWVAALSATGRSSSSVRKAYAVLRRVLEVAVEHELLHRNPAAKVKAPKEERREMRFLELSEVVALADAMDARYRAFVLLGCYGGLRWGELAGLRQSRIDFKRGTVSVAEQVQELNDGSLSWGEPKTRAGRRTVPLPRVVLTALEEHLAANVSPDPAAVVFTGPDGGVLRAGNFRRRHWVPACRAAGVEGLRIHDMRHTAVALAIATGAHPKALQERFGHASITMTLDRYGHLLDGQSAQIAAGLDALAEAAVVLATPALAASVVPAR